MSHRRFEPGTVLADKYRLDGLLGEGGMGTVYRATHLLLKAPVAIKVIDREVSSGDVALARFMREAQAAASLRSPHVVQVLDYGSAEGSPFMVMELLEGENLAQRIERVGRLTPGETYRVITHVARAIAKAHEAGIVHRDLKPDNVFLVHNEGDEVAKVLDFGVAKVETTALGGGSHTRTGSLLGTPYYMSPEQAQGNKEVDHRSDLWALAVISFECLTGKRPFYSDGLGDIVLQICVRDIPRPSSVAEVPAGFDDWFARATQREPADRFQSARELSEALREALGVQRDPSGSVPESQWSTAAVPPVSRVSAASDASTERDRVRVDALTMESAPGYSPVPEPVREAPVPDVVPRAASAPDEPSVPPGQRSARWEESAPHQGPAHSPSANWQVVPRAPSDPPAAKLLKPESEPPPPRRGFFGVFLVAALALSLGAGAVYLAREYGSDFVARTLRGETKAKAPKAKKTKKTTDASATQSAKKAGESASSDKPQGARGTSAKAASAADKSSPKARDDRKDEDAALEEFERQLRVDPPSHGPVAPSSAPAPPAPNGSATPASDGPTPGAPDSLIPPPPPPPPPVEPAPTSGPTTPPASKP